MHLHPTRKRSQHGRILRRSRVTSGYVGLSQRKKQKLEVAGSSGAVQALRMENDAPVVGPGAPTANSKMVKLEIATGDWSRPTSGLGVARSVTRCDIASAAKIYRRRFEGKHCAV